MVDQDRLSGLQANKGVDDVHPYSKLLRRMRTVIIVGVVVIFTVLIAWPQLSTIETAPLTREDVMALRQAETENTLVNPVFNSTDRQGNPMVITADQAKQFRDLDHIVILSAPQATFSNYTNTPMSIKAKDGVYDQNADTLELNSDIVLEMDQGTIKGEKLLINQQKQTITFQGRTKAVIHNKKN
jgi:hypothetical protein